MRDLFFGLWYEGVLDAENDVGAGAAAGRLLQEEATLEGRGQAGHRSVAGSPGFTVVVGLSLAMDVWAVPHHLLWPGAKKKKKKKRKPMNKEEKDRRRKAQKIKKITKLINRIWQNMT